MGPWRFIIIPSTILLAWILPNVTAYVRQLDPYPFLLVKLALSFQAAYAALFIMMSQNPQQNIDRKQAENEISCQRQCGAGDWAAAPEDPPATGDRGNESDRSGEGPHRDVAKRSGLAVVDYCLNAIDEAGARRTV
jgi:hypothetical protein